MSEVNLWSLAQEKYCREFEEWFRNRLSLAESKLTGLYLVSDVFEKLLGQDLRIYSKWEKVDKFPTYPVPKPYRVGNNTRSPRAYTMHQVVDIAFWFFLRSVMKVPDGMITIRRLSLLLQMSEEDVYRRMRDKRIPRNEEGFWMSPVQYSDWVGSWMRKGAHGEKSVA